MHLRSRGGEGRHPDAGAARGAGGGRQGARGVEPEGGDSDDGAGGGGHGDDAAACGGGAVVVVGG